MIKVSADSDYQSFEDMAIQLRHLILKPLDSSMGKGIKAISIDTKEQAREEFDKLLNEGEAWIVEERIKQSESMAVWNESSVNTVRVLSFLRNGDFHVLTPFLRTGRKGSIVDNAGSGGIFANVDAQIGILSTEGIDECGIRYEKHPDSGLQFIGWQIPQYEELIATVRKMHTTIMPSHPYIGWDMALTAKEWVVIESNWGQFVNQYADHIGLKNKFLEYVTGKRQKK